MLFFSIGDSNKWFDERVWLYFWLTWDFASRNIFHFPCVIYKISIDMDKRGLIVSLVWWNVGPEYWRESNRPIQVHCPLAYCKRRSLSFFLFPISKTSMGKPFKKIDLDHLLFLKGKLLSPVLPYVSRSGWLEKSLHILGNRVASSRFLPFLNSFCRDI